MSSRFLRKSTRRQIRDFDNFQNAYPNLRRSSDQTNLTFDNKSPFDDTKTIRFATDGVNFPSMTPKGYNTLPSSSISLSSLTKIRVSSQEYLPDLPGNAQSLPFNETRVNIPGTEDYIATSSIYRAGFKSATRNKIAIPIDISTNKVKTLFKLSQHDTALDPDGPLYGSGSTGFVYYNFQEKRWEDIGLTDQYRGHMGDHSYETIATSSATFYPSLTSSNYYMSQFRGSPNTFGAAPRDVLGAPIPSTDSDYLSWNGLGYAAIGSPHWFFDAPAAPRYHATSSQLIDLSSYINQPFILEEIEFSIPISATRQNGNYDTPAGVTRVIPQHSARDMDGINFFLYRQSGDRSSNSKRKIISYGTTTFYKTRFRQSNGVITKDFSLPERLVRLHNPAQYYEHVLDPTASFAQSTITENLNFKITPKNTTYYFNSLTTNAVTKYFSISGSKSYSYNIGTQNWESADTEQFLSDNIPIRNYIAGGSSFIQFKRFTAIRNEDSTGLENTQNIKNLSTDSRFIYKTEVKASLTSYQASLFNEPGPSPYILFPSDKLILGAESLVTVVTTSVGGAAGYDSSYLSLTSSLHKILSGSARITLYGSLIQNNQEKLFNNLNQNLVSPAIHELVFDPTEDSDQFLIGERYAYTGSYLDNFMSPGTVLNGTRYVSASLTAENTPVGGRGSFERFLSFSNPDEVYYDCLITDSQTIDTEDSAFSYEPTTDTFAPITGSGGNNYFQTDGILRPNFPYKSGKFRTLVTPSLGIAGLKYKGKDFKTAFFYTGKNQSSDFPYDIKSFFSSSYPNSNYIAYGMLNVENQQPRNIFRPDRYGQMRDMLEQSFDTITYKLIGVKGPTEPPVTINFVSASSETTVRPDLTNSNNLNVHASSSLPYFDGLNRSRSTPFPTSSLGPFTPTTIVFQT